MNDADAIDCPRWLHDALLELNQELGPRRADLVHRLALVLACLEIDDLPPPRVRRGKGWGQLEWSYVGGELLRITAARGAGLMFQCRARPALTPEELADWPATTDGLRALADRFFRRDRARARGAGGHDAP